MWLCGGQAYFKFREMIFHLCMSLPHISPLFCSQSFIIEDTVVRCNTVKFLLLIKIGLFFSSMQNKSCELAGPLSLMTKEAFSAEKNPHVGTLESTSEDSSSYDLFYDSLSEIQDVELSNELSAFLNEEERSKSLELAEESITMNPEKEGGNIGQEVSYFFNISSDSLGDSSPRKIIVSDQEASKRTKVTNPNSLTIAAQTLPQQNKQNTCPQEANNFCKITGKQSSLFSLLPASPSFIRSLKTAERSGSSGQMISSESEAASSKDAPFRDKLCDKAATLIEELSSIFTEVAKARVRSPDGNSSSPDSGYLSPKNKPSAMSSSLRNPSCDKTQPEITAENEILAVTHNGGRKEGPVASENASLGQLMKNSHGQLSAPRFTQKLRSQEVAEGSKVLLECRVTGNPMPDVR